MGLYFRIEEKPAAELCFIVEQHPRGARKQIYAKAATELQPPIG